MASLPSRGTRDDASSGNEGHKSNEVIMWVIELKGKELDSNLPYLSVIKINFIAAS